MVKIHVVSDLHLEFNSHLIPSIDKLIPLEVDTSKCILILAGDIGYPWTDTYWNFLKSCSDRYYHVIFTTGNHEYYSDDYDWNQINDMIISTPKPTNLHFLHKSKIEIDGVTFLGCTLWTKIPPNRAMYVREYMNDYEYISTNKSENKLLTTNDVNTEHNVCVEWLHEEIISTISDRLVVITHHLPTFALIHSKYSKYEKTNCGFASDLHKLFTTKIKHWICGHTHCKMKWTNTFGTNFLVNPFGYEGENSEFVVEELEA